MTASVANTALSPKNGPQFEKEEKEDAVSIASSPHGQSLRVGPVAFEDYLYYAALQRKEEDRVHEYKDKNSAVSVQSVSSPMPMTTEEEERARASRSLRLAGWFSIFYLITSDILGPYNAPFAISQVGWGPGIILYAVMGAMAFYTALILWRLFFNYGEMAERMFGKPGLHVCNILQSIQLIVNVAGICLANGQALAQITRGRLCFSVCIVIWTFVGITIGQIRTLKNFGWLSNGAVWINITTIILSMAFIANSAPNFSAAQKSLGVDPSEPIRTQVFASLPLHLKVNGIMNMVFAYGGSMIFPEMMAEMKRPMDFWKAMTVAQILIFSAYLTYGAVVYSFQGQFTLPLAYQGVSKYAWQTVGNVLSLITGIVAAGLYGNVGIKVAYHNIVEDWMGGPALMSTKGRYIWSIVVCLYWSLAFVIGSAIPQIQTITGLIAAVAIMQFTYSFPPLMRLAYDVITDAMAEDRQYVAGHGAAGRIDTWSNWSRWKRGLFGGRVYFKAFNLVVTLGALAMACLGMWGAGTSIKATFELAGAATSFGCAAPV